MFTDFLPQVSGSHPKVDNGEIPPGKCSYSMKKPGSSASLTPIPLTVGFDGDLGSVKVDPARLVIPCSKRAAGNRFPRLLIEILLFQLNLAEATMGTENLYKLLCEYLYRNQVTLIFEVVAGRVGGDHGFANLPGKGKTLRPRCAFVVVTDATTAGEDGSPRSIGIINLLKLCEQFCLPMVSTWIGGAGYAEAVSGAMTPEFKAACLHDDVVRVLNETPGGLAIPGLDGGVAIGEICEGLIVRGMSDSADPEVLADLDRAIAKYSARMARLLTPEYYESLATLRQQLGKLPAPGEPGGDIPGLDAPRADGIGEVQALPKPDPATLLEQIAEHAPGAAGKIARMLRNYSWGKWFITHYYHTVKTASGDIVYGFFVISPSGPLGDEIYYSCNLHAALGTGPQFPRGLIVWELPIHTKYGAGVATRGAQEAGSSLPADPFGYCPIKTVKYKFGPYIASTMAFRNSGEKAARTGSFTPRLAELGRQFGFNPNSLDQGLLKLAHELAQVYQNAECNGVLDKVFNPTTYIDSAENIGKLYANLVTGAPKIAVVFIDRIGDQPPPQKKEKGKKAEKVFERPDARAEAFFDASAGGYIVPEHFAGLPGTRKLARTPPGISSACVVTVILTKVPPGELDRGTQKMLSKISGPVRWVQIDEKEPFADTNASKIADTIAWLQQQSDEAAAAGDEAAAAGDEVAAAGAEAAAAGDEASNKSITYLFFANATPGIGKSRLAGMITPYLGAKAHLLQSDVTGTNKFYDELAALVASLPDGNWVVVVDRNFPGEKGVNALLTRVEKIQQKHPHTAKFLLTTPKEIKLDVNAQRIRARPAGEHGMPPKEGFEELISGTFYADSVGFRRAIANGSVPFVEIDYYTPGAEKQNLAALQAALGDGPDSALTSANEIRTLFRGVSSKAWPKIAITNNRHVTILAPDQKGPILEAVLARLADGNTEIALEITDYKVFRTSDGGGMEIAGWSVADSSIPAELRSEERAGAYHVTDMARKTENLPPVECFHALRALHTGAPTPSGIRWEMVHSTPINKVITGTLVYGSK